MTLKCPCCGRTTAAKGCPDATMFVALLDGNDRDLVICVACRNIVTGPPGEEGCLFLPSDERLAAEVTAIQRTARFIDQTQQEVRARSASHQACDEGYLVSADGAIEFCFKASHADKRVMKIVQATLDKLGFQNAKQAGRSRLCRLPCPSQEDYHHVMVRVIGIAVETQDG